MEVTFFSGWLRYTESTKDLGGVAGLVIYLDLVVALNFAVDFLLLVGTNCMTGFPPSGRRSALGAAVGGIYGGVCILPGFRFLGSGIWRPVFLFLIGSAAFGWNRSALRRIPVFLILNMALGGIAAGSGVTSFPEVLISGGFLWILCRSGSQLADGRKYIPAELNWKGNRVKLFALRDTGNTLSDPITGEQVLVCGADVAEELLGVSRTRFRDPVEIVASGMIPGLRLIPYRSVGKSKGMLPAIRLEDAVIGGITGGIPHKVS